MASSLATLRLPAFARLASAYLVNEFGNWLGEVALAIIVFDLTHSPVATAALFIAMQFVPAIGAPPLVGRADALTARRALSLIYLAEAACFGILALVPDTHEAVLVPVLALAALDGSLASAARARSRAAAAAILEPAGSLREGNAVLNFAFTAGAAAGPAVAGVVVAAAGTQIALLADAASFLVATALVASARSLPAAHGSEAGGWIEPLREGFRYVRERVTLRRLLLAEAIAFVFFALALPIEVVLAKETLNAGDTGYGFLLTAWGVGMVLGGIAFGGLRTSLVWMLVTSTLLLGVGYLGMGAAPSIEVACLASAVGGLGNGVQWVAVITAVQGLTAAGFQARVVSMLESLANIASGAGFLLGGAIGALLSPRAAFAVAGGGVLVVLAGAAFLLRDWGSRQPEDRDLAAVGAQPAHSHAEPPESAQI